MGYVQHWWSRRAWQTSNTVTPSATPGNFLLAIASTNGGTISYSAGWATETHVSDTNIVLWRVATGDSQDALTITHNSAQYSKILIAELSGVDTADPIDVVMQGSYARWDGSNVDLSLDDDQPYEAAASRAGFAVATLSISGSTTLSDRYSPSVGGGYNEGNVFLGVLPEHQADEIVDYSWIQDPSAGSSVYWHHAHLVLLNAADQAGGDPASTVPGPVVQGQKISPATLAQHHALVPDSIGQAQGVSQPALSAGYEVAPDAVTQGQAVRSPALNAEYGVSPELMAQSQSIGQPSLAAEYDVSPGTVTQSQAASEPVLSPHLTLIVSPVRQAQSASSPSLSQQGTVVPDAITQAQAASIVSLIQHHMLMPDGLVQPSALSEPTLDQQNQIQAAQITQSQVLGNVSLEQHNILVVDGLTQSQLLSMVQFGDPIIGTIEAQIMLVSLIDGKPTMQPLIDSDPSIH